MNKVFINAEDIPLPSWTKAAERFIKKVLDKLEKKNWEVSVLFCNNRFIKTLNAQYRNKDEPTDVLSFSADGNIAGGNGRYIAGDIVISLDAVEENAGFFKVSSDEELRRLLVHGILHLSGLDHDTNKTGEPMLVIQEEIIAALKEERIQENNK